MKKMFTLLVGLVTFSALFAQYDKPYDNRGNDDRRAQYEDRSYNHPDDNYRPDHAVEMRRDDNRWQPGNRMNDRDRRAGMDRINHDYDRRIDAYRKDRRMNRWERDHEIDRLQRERNGKLKAFGGGALLGGILGVIIGSQL